MPRASEATRRDRLVPFSPRRWFACAAAAAVLGAAHAGAEVPDEGTPGQWFRSPVSGVRYVVEHDAERRTKTLVGPDGSRFASVQAILEAESSALPPLERRMTAELRELAADPSRAEELVNVTCIYANQPLHAAGVAARARANPALRAELARSRRILDRIAPLRTFPGGRAPDVASAVKQESALLTDAEKTTLREVRDSVRKILAHMRREALADATAACAKEQAGLLEWVRALPGALDLGGTVVLNARSARIPARALHELAERFPEVMHIRRVPLATGNMDTAATTVGAGNWWNGGYVGSSTSLFASIDTGVDTSHPALTNAVAASGIYHTTASTVTGYADSTSNPDDYQGHGTTAAGILVSTDSTYPGMAYGAQILNAKGAFYSTSTGASSMYFSDGRLAADWAANNGATAFILSFGGTGTNNGTDEFALWFDAAASSLGIPACVAAKNYGPSSSTLGYPGCGFNSITVGNFDDNGTTSLSDDSLYNTSGRGPTSDGRQKPDICGPGVNITTCAHDWETTGNNFVSFSPGTTTGTSTVGPIVCGALGLLQDYGAASTSEGQKALLLTTANQASPYGGPDSNWGYGALDCGGAYTYRGSVYEGELTSSGPKYVLLRGGALSSGGRATLVWNRSVTANGSAIPTTYYGIQDLDLYVYDGATGKEIGSSKSTVDPNEQVSVSSAVDEPVYKVVLAASSFTSSYSTEPFAVAAESASSTSPGGPALECSFTQFDDEIAGSTETTVTVAVSNPGDLVAPAPSVQLTLPSGYQITSGDNPRTLSDLAGSDSTSVTWKVRTSSGPSGTGTFSVEATASAFGETVAAEKVSRDQLLDVDPPQATLSIEGDAVNTGTRDVTVALSATDSLTGVPEMRVRNAGEAWGSWVDYATSLDVTLTAGDGTKTVEAEFRDGVGNVTPTVSDSIVYDTTPPLGAILIQGGADYWKSSQVTLNLDATDAGAGVTEMRFSSDGTTWSSWVTYSPTESYTLPLGDGTRTVHAEFVDGAGFTSEVVKDSIVVDSAAPSGSVLIAGGATWTSTRTVTVTLSASDAASGVSEMRLSDLGNTWSAWMPYSTSAQWTLAGEGVRSVYAQFRDRAGNESTSASDTISVDTAAPTGSISIAGGANYTTATSVSLTLTATDPTSGVSQMRFSDDGSTWGAWKNFATSSSWTLPSEDGAKRVYVQFVDNVGNVSQAYSDAITMDTVAPTGALAIEGGRAAINSADVKLNLTWSDDGSGVWEARMSNDGANWTGWYFAAASLDWTVAPADGDRTAYVQLRDRAGNVSGTLSDSILVDTVAPQGTFAVAGNGSYVLPWEELSLLATATDAGSGVAEVRTSADDGATWSAWVPLDGAGRAALERPASGADRLLALRAEIRDAAGNVAAAGTDGAYLVADDPPSTTVVKTLVGVAGAGGDHDAFRMGLVAGDQLSLKLKTKPLAKGADARLDVDVYGPDRTLLVSGRYPATGKKPGVTKFPAPATGEYWIVLRPAGAESDAGVAYTVTVTNAAAKAPRAPKGTATYDGSKSVPAATVQFDAAEGLTLSGSLKGPLASTPPSLLSPDGTEIPVTLVPGKKGALNLVALPLLGGTGTWTLTIPATGDVTYSLKVSPGKPGRIEEP